jgi:hypothetical protein
MGAGHDLKGCETLVPSSSCLLLLATGARFCSTVTPNMMGASHRPKAMGQLTTDRTSRTVRQDKPFPVSYVQHCPLHLNLSL